MTEAAGGGFVVPRGAGARPPAVLTEWLERRHYACAAVGSNETKALYRPKKGQRVMNVSLQWTKSAAAASTATITVGDATTTNGYVLSTSAVQTVGAVTDGLGAYLVSQSGKLYTVLDTINLYYTAGAGAGVTAPACDVLMRISQEWPETT